MSYRLTKKPPVLYVSWRGFTSRELREVTEELAEMQRTSGKPVAYLSRIPAGAYVFTDGDQAVLLRFLQTILAYCATIHHIVDGDGFIKSARLAIVTNLALATARPRDLHTHASIEDAAEVIKELYGVDFSEANRGSDKPERERASGAFRAAARMVDGRRPPPRKG
jgi:hypothetical protein